jgi:hypothetical protein
MVDGTGQNATRCVAVIETGAMTERVRRRNGGWVGTLTATIVTETGPEIETGTGIGTETVTETMTETGTGTGTETETETGLEIEIETALGRAHPM